MKLVPLIIASILFACSQKPNNNNQVSKDNSTVIKLEYGFSISFAGYEDFKTFKTYFKTKVYQNNVVVFTDSITEFEIKSNYPSVRKIGDKYELWLIVNDRPSIEKTKILTIDHSGNIKSDLIPFFEMAPKDIDDDGESELVGIMSYFEMSGENYDYMPYVPLLVYEYKATGVVLDSITTKKINSSIYGKFYGFDYNENYSFLGSERFTKELEKYK